MTSWSTSRCGTRTELPAIDDPRRTILRVYRHIDDGFLIPDDEESAIRASRGSPTYGEITPTSVDRMLSYLQMTERDVFYDLGSGVGKVINQVAISVPVRRCVGVELSETRVRLARAALRQLRREVRIEARRCSFRCENLLDTSLDDATVIYTCSTAFSWRFLLRLCRRVRAIGRPVRFLSVQELEPIDGFEHVETLRLDMTWQRRDRLYVYEVSGAPDGIE